MTEWELTKDSEIFEIENTGQEELINLESHVSMETECPVPFNDDFPLLSSHTAVPPSQDPIHTTFPPVQTEIGPPDLSASAAADSPLVGQEPLGYGGDIWEGDSFLEEIEILRMSSPPPSKQRRHQSPSPESQGRRLLTPTKVDKTPSTKKRTPRKDTPVKKRTRVQCRVRGCRDYLASVRARDRHEKEYCRFREGAGSGLSADTFPVSSHADLQIDTLQCRVCLKAFQNEKARKRHERDTHQIFDIKGRTFSPVRFSSPVLSEIPLRPQSCPPPQVEEHSGFVTPETPQKRRRAVSSSTASLLSPCMGSPLSSPCLNLSPQFSPSLDVSPLGSPLLVLTPRSGSSASSPGVPSSFQCCFCGASFLNLKNQKRHQCIFRPDVHFFKSNAIIPQELVLPKNWEQTIKILSQLCKEDIVMLCRLNKWCLPSYYPFVFHHHHRSGNQGNPPLIEKMTASSSSSELLKRMVDIDGKFDIPKHLLLRDEATQQISYLSPSVLAPPEVFHFSEHSDGFLVMKRDGNDEAFEDLDDEDDICLIDEEDDIFPSDSEDDDVLYSCCAPAPLSRSESNESYSQLPTPPYTSLTDVNDVDDADSECPTPVDTSNARTDDDCEDGNNGDRGDGRDLNGGGFGSLVGCDRDAARRDGGGGGGGQD